MTVSNASSGGASGSSGTKIQSSTNAVDPQGQTDTDSGDAAPQTVAYETYQKLLAEKKRRDDELRTIRQKEKEREEKELQDQNNFKQLLSLREKELEEERARKRELEHTLDSGMKLRALLDAIQGKVEQKYWNLIDLEKITINPETKMPDPVSVNSVARDFEKRFPEIVRKGSGAGLPNEAAKPSGALTYQEWIKLPAKEMRKRMGEVDQSTLP